MAVLRCSPTHAITSLLQGLGAMARGDPDERISESCEGASGRLKIASNTTVGQLIATITSVREASGNLVSASKEPASTCLGPSVLPLLSIYPPRRLGGSKVLSPGGEFSMSPDTMCHKLLPTRPVTKARMEDNCADEVIRLIAM